MFLTKIGLQNFKIHKNTTINPKKITIFIGPNGSGKSSILQALLILKKSLERQTREHFVTSDGTFDLGKYDDLVGFGKINNPLSISISGKKLFQ